jgi:hypothetical protein
VVALGRTDLRLGGRLERDRELRGVGALLTAVEPLLRVAALVRVPDEEAVVRARADVVARAGESETVSFELNVKVARHWKLEPASLDENWNVALVS